MPVSVTFNISDAYVRQRLERVGRRIAAQRIRRAGEAVGNIASAEAYGQLAVRAPSRRRVGGPHYQNSFSVTYSGLADVEGGAPLSFTIKSNHQMAALIEHGSPGHTISPRKGSRGGKKKGRLTWPAADYSQPGPPWKTLAPGQSVRHSGTRPYKIMSNATKSALRGAFGTFGRQVR